MGETIKLRFPGADGDMLAAALEMPSQMPSGYALFAHCFTCTKDIRAARDIARALKARGIAVLRFDFTGIGGSEGDFANTNFSSNVDDLVAAADFLRREHQAPSLLIGHSLGGAAVIVAASRIEEIKAVATIGAPSAAAHVAHMMRDAEDEIAANGYATVRLAGRPFTIKAQFLEDLKKQSVTTCAATLKKPLLVLHAPRDQTVGIDNASEIFKAAKHPKSFVSLDTADHLLSDEADALYAAELIASWAARYIGKSARIDDAPMRVDKTHGGYAEMVPDKALAVSAAAGRHPIFVDAGTEDGGEGLGPNPTKLLEASLAACTVMTLRMYAGRKKWPIATLSVSVNRADGEDAHYAQLLEKEISITGDLDAEQREKLHEIADKCPVHRMLSNGVTIRSRIA